MFIRVLAGKVMLSVFWVVRVRVTRSLFTFRFLYVPMASCQGSSCVCWWVQNTQPLEVFCPLIFPSNIRSRQLFSAVFQLPILQFERIFSTSEGTVELFKYLMMISFIVSLLNLNSSLSKLLNNGTYK